MRKRRFLPIIPIVVLIGGAGLLDSRDDRLDIELSQVFKKT